MQMEEHFRKLLASAKLHAREQKFGETLVNYKLFRFNDLWRCCKLRRLDNEVVLRKIGTR